VVARVAAELASGDAARKSLMRRGEVWAAYDLARSALERDDATPEVAHDAVLCLARSGAADFALSEYVRLGLSQRPDRATRALGARLLKDIALRRRSDDGQTLALEAAAAYGAVYEDFGGIHSLVNQAMLLLLSGLPAQSADVARRVLASPSPDEATDDLTCYYDLAARAEARLILGDLSAAEALVLAAAQRAPADRAARISTLRQLERIADFLGESSHWLSPLRAPPVGHYTGHIYCLEPDQRGGGEGRLHTLLVQTLQESGVGVVYGGLAAGGDILWAEAALALGVDLHVVLPMNADSYRRTSVAPYGSGWIARHDACLAAAASVRFSSLEDNLGDDETFLYGARYAMGCAAADAELKAATAVQLVLCESGRDQDSLTSQDAQWWAQTGRPQFKVDAQKLGLQRATPAEKTAFQPSRPMRAMLFVDFKGFGRLDDTQTQTFFSFVMAALARTLAKLDVGPQHVETWGDGVFLVFEEPDAAAHAAIAIIDSHAALDLTAHALPPDLGVRIGGHYGPVHLGFNPVTGGPSVVGTHVVAAARIEPDATPGAAYVSEAFAGLLVARHSDKFLCGYVGRSSGRKETALRPLFSLSPR